MLACHPDEGDGKLAALGKGVAEQLFVKPVGLTYLALDAVTIHSVLEVALRHADEDLGDG